MSDTRGCTLAVLQMKKKERSLIEAAPRDFSSGRRFTSSCRTSGIHDASSVAQSIPIANAKGYRYDDRCFLDASRAKEFLTKICRG